MFSSIRHEHERRGCMAWTQECGGTGATVNELVAVHAVHSAGVFTLIRCTPSMGRQVQISADGARIAGHDSKSLLTAFLPTMYESQGVIRRA